MGSRLGIRGSTSSCTSERSQGNEREARAQLQQEALHFANDGVFQVGLAVAVVQAEEVKQVGVAEHQIGS